MSLDIDDPRFVKAMSHPLRVRLLAMLREQESTPRGLATTLGASLGVVAYHVRTLESLGLIELVGETTVRGAIQHHYRATAPPTVNDEVWGRASVISKQVAVDSTLQVIDDYARASAGAGGFDREGAHLTRTRLELDAQGWDDLGQACQALLDRADEIGAQARERLDDAGGDPHDRGSIPTSLVVMSFESVLLSEAAVRAQREHAPAEQHAGQPG